MELKRAEGGRRSSRTAGRRQEERRRHLQEQQNTITILKRYRQPMAPFLSL